MNQKLMNSVALMVVDMQDGFLRAIPESEALLWRCCFAVEAARLLGLRTFFTTQVPEKLGEVSPRLLSRHPEAPVYAKTAFSALQAPGLKEALERHEIDHLIVAGIEVPICVYQTAIDAANDELAITLLSDCVGGRRKQDSQPVLGALSRIGCHILPSETVFYSILGEAGHPAFKPFTALVKKYSGEAFAES